MTQPSPEANSSAGKALDPHSKTLARFTVLTAIQPDTCSKTFSISKSDDKLDKLTVADVSRGSVAVQGVASLADFAAILGALKHDNALIYGVPPRDQMELVTSKEWQRAGMPADKVARTAQAFRWPAGGGVMFLDYDAPSDAPALSRDELVLALVTACPGLGLPDLLWLPSSSSHIVNTKTGQDLTGLKGQRLYLLVADASDIPRAGAALVAHLWASGFGHCEVSAAGTVLERTLVDSSVWQTNRIDFAAGAVTVPPLEQRRGEPIRITGLLGIEICDTATAIPDPTPEILALVSTAKGKARADVAERAERVRAEWSDQRVNVLTAKLTRERRDLTPEQARAQAVDAVERAVERRDLYGDWPLEVQDRHGEWRMVTVGDVLDAPYTWHGCKTRDPLEPEYDGGRTVGKLFLVGARPVLHSMAHGGQTFQLHRQLSRVQLVQGKESQATDDLLEIMRRQPHLFDYGSGLVIPRADGSGELHEVNRATVAYHVGKSAQFFRRRVNAQGVEIERLENPPQRICDTVLGKGAERKLKRLDAVTNAPIMRPDGTIQDAPGYDGEVRLFLDMDEAPLPVPDNPSAAELRKALATLWEPVAHFPYDTPDCRAVTLAAMLTAIQRPVLGATPAFAFDAPRQGTGKSLLAESIGVLATGTRPAAWPHVERNEEEVRKRLLAALRHSKRVMLWDNIMGAFDSAAVATMLTQSHFTDRVLGTNNTETYPNKALVLLTGNNFTPAGELPRRVLTCRLDAKSETPFTRTFDFDPRTRMEANHLHMVRAGLTLLRGYVCAGRPRLTPDSLGSFEQWDGMVRQAVLWVAKNVADPDFLGDPIQSVRNQATADPALEVLGDVLHALANVFGGSWFNASGLATICQEADRPGGLVSAPRRRLADALSDMLTRGKASSRAIGRVLTFNRDKPVDGLVLKRSAQPTQRVYHWRIERLDGKPIVPSTSDSDDSFVDLNIN